MCLLKSKEATRESQTTVIFQGTYIQQQTIKSLRTSFRNFADRCSTGNGVSESIAILFIIILYSVKNYAGMIQVLITTISHDTTMSACSVMYMCKYIQNHLQR